MKLEARLEKKPQLREQPPGTWRGPRIQPESWRRREGWLAASHLELLAHHGLHVALFADGEIVGNGGAPGVVLGPGEGLPVLLHL